MSSITQTTSLKGSLVWMGSCENETCEDFDLTPYSQGGANEGIINFIYQVGSGTVGEMWKGDQPSMFNSLNGSDDSNTLFCGKCYYIMLNPATDSNNPFVLAIPGATFAFSDSPNLGQILDPESTKPLYIPDLSKAAAVISDKSMTNFIKDPYVPVRPADATEVATTKGIMVKADGTHVSFAAGDTINVKAGAKVFFDTLTHFTSSNNSLVDVARFFQTDYSNNPFTHTSQDPEDFIEKSFDDEAILIDPDGNVYDDVSSPINVKPGWTLIEGKQKRTTDKSGNPIALPNQAPSSAPPSIQDFSGGVEEIDLNSSNHELDLNLKSLSTKGRKQFKFTGKDWGEQYSTDNLSGDAITSGSGWTSADWSVPPTATFDIDRNTGKITVTNASLPDQHNEGIIFDIPIEMVAKTFTGSESTKGITAKIKLKAAHLTEGNPINYSGSGIYTTEGGVDVTPPDLVGADPSYDSGIINKSGNIILKQFDYINKIGLIVNDDGSHTIATRSPAPVRNLSSFLKYSKPPRTHTLTASAGYSGSGAFSTAVTPVNPPGNLNTELSTYQGTLDGGTTNTSTSDIQVHLLPFAQTGVIILDDGTVTKVDNDGDGPITLPPGATLIRHLRGNTEGVEDAGYTGEGTYTTPSGEPVNIGSFLALANSGVVNNTNEDKEVFAKPDSILVRDDGSVTKVEGLTKNTSGFSPSNNTVTLSPKVTLFSGSYVSESTGSDLNNSGSTYTTGSGSTVDIHQELGKGDKDIIGGGIKNNTPITIKKGLKENEVGLLVGPDGTTTTVTTSPVSVPPGSVLFIKRPVDPVQISAHSGGDVNDLGSGSLFATNTSSGAAFTVLFYDFGRVINSDTLTISGHSFTGGTATFTVRTGTDAYLDPAEARAQFGPMTFTDYVQPDKINETEKTEDFSLNLTEPFRYVAIDMTGFGGNGAFRARNVEFDSEKPTYKVIVQNSTSGAEYQGSTVGYTDSANNTSNGFTETVSSGDTLDLSQPGFVAMTRPALNNSRAFDKWAIVSGTGSILNASDPSNASAIIDEGEVVISPTFKDSSTTSSVVYSGGLYNGISLSSHSVDPSAILNAPADKITAYINNSGSDFMWMKQLHSSGEDILLLVNNTTGETSLPSENSGTFSSGYTKFVVYSGDQLAPSIASALAPGSVNEVVTSESPPATADANLTKWLAKQLGATEFYHSGHPSDVSGLYGSWENELGRQYNQTTTGGFVYTRYYYSSALLFDGTYYRLRIEVKNSGSQLYIDTQTGTQTSNPWGAGYFSSAGSSTNFRLSYVLKSGALYNKTYNPSNPTSGFSLDLNYRANPEWDMNYINVHYTGAATGTPGDSDYTITSSGGTTVDITDIMSNASIYSDDSGQGKTVTINDITNTLLIGPDGTIYHIPTGTTELFIPDGFSVLTGTSLVDSSTSGYATWIPIIMPEASGFPPAAHGPMYAVYEDGNSSAGFENLIGDWAHGSIPNIGAYYNDASYFTKDDPSNGKTFYLYYFPDTTPKWVISYTLGLSGNWITTNSQSQNPTIGAYDNNGNPGIKFISGAAPDTDPNHGVTDPGQGVTDPGPDTDPNQGATDPSQSTGSTGSTGSGDFLPLPAADTSSPYTPYAGDKLTLTVAQSLILNWNTQQIIDAYDDWDILSLVGGGGQNTGPLSLEFTYLPKHFSDPNRLTHSGAAGFHAQTPGGLHILIKNSSSDPMGNTYLSDSGYWEVYIALELGGQGAQGQGGDEKVFNLSVPADQDISMATNPILTTLWSPWDDNYPKTWFDAGLSIGSAGATAPTGSTGSSGPAGTDSIGFTSATFSNFDTFPAPDNGNSLIDDGNVFFNYYESTSGDYNISDNMVGVVPVPTFDFSLTSNVNGLSVSGLKDKISQGDYAVENLYLNGNYVVNFDLTYLGTTQSDNSSSAGSTGPSGPSGPSGSSGSTGPSAWVPQVGDSVQVHNKSADGYVALVESYPDEYYNKYSESPSQAEYHIHYADGTNDSAYANQLTPGGTKTSPNFNYTFLPYYNIGDVVYYRHADSIYEAFEIIKVSVANQNYALHPLTPSNSYSPEVSESDLATDPYDFSNTGGSTGSSGSSGSTGGYGGGYGGGYDGGGGGGFQVDEVVWWQDSGNGNWYNARITNINNGMFAGVYYDDTYSQCSNFSNTPESRISSMHPDYNYSATDPSNYGCY